MSQKMLDIVHKRCELLRRVVHELDDLCQAANVMGNINLANRLDDISMSVHNSQEKIEKAVHKDIHDQVSANMAQVGKTLGALAESS